MCIRDRSDAARSAFLREKRGAAADIEKREPSEEERREDEKGICHGAQSGSPGLVREESTTKKRTPTARTTRSGMRRSPSTVEKVPPRVSRSPEGERKKAERRQGYGAG